MGRILSIIGVVILISSSVCAQTSLECDPNNVALYRAALKYALTDSSVISGWGNVYETENYYVLKDENTLLRSLAGDRALFNLFYGKELEYRDSVHLAMLQLLPLRGTDYRAQRRYIPNACLKQLHVSADSAKKVCVEFHHYNDSVLIVFLYDNERFFEEAARQENRIPSYPLPMTCSFLYLHREHAILQSHSAGLMIP